MLNKDGCELSPEKAGTPSEHAGDMRTGWQPISTAPKDGTWFVICREGESTSLEVGAYDPLFLERYVPSGIPEHFRKERYVALEWRGFNNFEIATHWHPLPPPPEVAP